MQCPAHPMDAYLLDTVPCIGCKQVSAEQKEYAEAVAMLEAQHHAIQRKEEQLRLLDTQLEK